MFPTLMLSAGAFEQ